MKEELFVHVAKEGTHLKFLAMNNLNHSKVDNVSMNYQWVSLICSGIGRPGVLDTLCRDPHLPFLYDPGENAWIGTDDAWTNKAVTDIDREELIANLQSASIGNAFQYLHSHLSNFPTSVSRVRRIHNAILAKMNVVHSSKFTNNDWADKAVTDIDREELIANLPSPSDGDAFQYLHSHLSDFPTSVSRVRRIHHAILAKLDVPLQLRFRLLIARFKAVAAEQQNKFKLASGEVVVRVPRDDMQLYQYACEAKHWEADDYRLELLRKEGVNLAFGEKFVDAQRISNVKEAKKLNEKRKRNREFFNALECHEEYNAEVSHDDFSNSYQL